MREERYVYKTTYQNFTKEIVVDGSIIFVELGGFRRNEIKERIIFSDNVVIVFLDDGTKGVAKCHPDDNYDRTTGIRIAYNRAKIKSLQKQLKQLGK